MQVKKPIPEPAPLNATGSGTPTATRSELDCAAGIKLRLIEQHLPVVMWTTDRDLRFTSFQGQGVEALPMHLVGKPGQSLLDYYGSPVGEFLPIRAAQRALQGETVSYEVDWGGQTWQTRVTPLRLDNGEIAGTVAMALDVSQQKLAVEEKLAEQQRYQDLFENANDIIYTQDLTGRFTSVNRACERITGFTPEEVIGMRFGDVLAPEDRALIDQMLHEKLGGRGQTTYDLTLIGKDGQRVFLEVSSRLLFEAGRPSGIQGIARDVTERKRLEEQLRQTQKMEAIGVLAGGIAHDFNNLLTGILGYVDLLKLGTRPGEHLFESLDVIQKAAEQAARLTSQLLGFARRGKNQNAPISLRKTMEEVLTLLSRTINKRIEIDTCFAPAEVQIMGDPGQMHQVFLNLAINASEAMPEGGRLTFRTALVQAPSPPSYSGEREEKWYVVATVGDTGVGISKEAQSRIFEPFFSTKPMGSGMGLAMVYGIVKNHGGFVRLQSEPGEGSQFHVYLPVAGLRVEDRPVAPQGTLGSGQGTILLVDDEDLVRRVVKMMMEEIGYRVMVASDGERAVEVFREHHQEIDLVIMDMVMPRMGGRECFVQMQQIDPNVRAMLSTGYSRDGAAQEILDLGMVGFIQKPYQRSALAEALVNALKQPRGAVS